MVAEGIVLEHKIYAAGLEVDQANVAIVRTLLPPIIVKGKRSFLGHVGFYRRFIRDFSKPLDNAYYWKKMQSLILMNPAWLYLKKLSPD